MPGSNYVQEGLRSLQLSVPEEDDEEHSDASTVKLPTKDESGEEDEGAPLKPLTASEKHPTLDLTGSSLVRTVWPLPGMTDTAYSHQMRKKERKEYSVDCSVKECTASAHDRQNHARTRFWLTPTDSGGTSRVVFLSTDLCDAHHQHSMTQGTLDDLDFAVGETPDDIDLSKERPTIVEGAGADWKKIGPMCEEDSCRAAGYQWTLSPLSGARARPGVTVKGTVNLCTTHAHGAVSGDRLSLKTPLETLYRRARAERARCERAEPYTTIERTKPDPITTFLNSICPSSSDVGSCTRRKSWVAKACYRCSAYVLDPPRCSGSCSSRSQSPISSLCVIDEQELIQEADCASCHGRPDLKWETVRGRSGLVNTVRVPSPITAEYCEKCFDRDISWIDMGYVGRMNEALRQNELPDKGWWLWAKTAQRRSELDKWVKRRKELPEEEDDA